ncbi:MAG TPA: hypothetical protein PKC21_09145 [Oligoflexia bacterium]|nr:hypothetical protein [Oligoflexia bacterium]HMR25503.1 hypothetical protein [Oligoflexia bacterium]
MSRIVFIILWVLLSSAHTVLCAQTQISFQERLEQLKPEVKQTIIENIRRYWTIKTVQKMQTQGFLQQDIEQLILSPSFKFFLDQTLNNPKTQASIDLYISRTLNEKNILDHVQRLEKQSKEHQLQEYKEILRIIAQMRKEQNYVQEKKTWYQRFFEDFKFF